MIMMHWRKSRNLLAALLAVMCGLSLIGCTGSGGGKLEIQGYGDKPTSAPGQFHQGIYRVDDDHNTTVLLFDGPIDQPTRAMTVRLFWQPRAGKTPIDATATNAVIQYIVFRENEGEQVGIYSGAGFLYPNTKIGKASFRGKIWEANLQLADRSEGFEDHLQLAVVSGSLTARRDDAAVDQVLRQLNEAVRQRLGYARLVQR